MNALHAAASGGHVGTAALLLERERQCSGRETSDIGRREILVDMKDKRSRSALHLASQAGHLEMAMLLLSHGADANAAAHEDAGGTALQMAFKNMDACMVMV